MEEFPGTGGPAVVALWSAPRSRSTAFLRMIAERGDHIVLHEPFSQLADFGAYDAAGRVVHTEAELIARILALAARGPVFFKDTTDFRYPGLLADRGFLRRVSHTFLIRDPAAAIASHFALNPRLTSAEVGFERLSEIHDAVLAAGGRAVVVDSDDLVGDPPAVVAAFCAAVGLDFRPAALTWTPGLLPQWQRTRRWHVRTGATGGFAPVPARYPHTVDNHPLLAAFDTHHRPFYQRLRDRRITTERSSRVR
jgi:sulfotransferase family protein